MARQFWTDRTEVSGSQLVDKVKEIAQDANARRVIVRDQQGKELFAVPLGWGAAGGAVALLTAPWLAVLAAAGGAMAKVRLEVERVGPGTGSAAPGSPDASGGMPVIRTDAPGWQTPPDDRG